MAAAISGATRLFGIVGAPIAQAQSPALFNALFCERGMDAVLVPYHVAPSDLADFVAAFRATHNFDGLVVTIPHKVAAMTAVDQAGPRATRLGALNAIARKADGQLVGENFDGVGFLRGLQSRGWEPYGRRAVVVGAGGAGVAICDALLEAGLSEIALHEPDEARGEWVRQRLTRFYPNAIIRRSAPAAKGYDLAINCSPVGMQQERELPLDLTGADAQTLIADIIMKPAETPLLRAARDMGLATHEGIEMLRGQVEAIADFFASSRSDA